MAISINDRQLITQFITNTQNLNVNLPTNGGGCANLVRGIIEHGNRKKNFSLNPFWSFFRKYDTKNKYLS